MALQGSGAISLNDMHVEAGGNTGTSVSINDSDIRDLIDKSSGATMSFNEWYGASAFTAWDISGGSDGGTSGNYKYRYFNSSANLSINTVGSEPLDYLVIAGGGSGAYSRNNTSGDGGGGGAGGYATGTFTPTSTGNISVTVGAGGSIGQGMYAYGVPYKLSNNGSNSSIAGYITATAGGGGGGGGFETSEDSIASHPGKNGGSGAVSYTHLTLPTTPYV